MMRVFLVGGLFSLLPAIVLAAVNCDSTTIDSPDVPGAEVLSVSATAISNYSYNPVSSTTPALAPISFCNITVTYMHPGWNDTINTTVWLPLDGWNNRLQGIGGGGYLGLEGTDTLGPAVSAGYAALGSDLGHGGTWFDPSSWALDESGRVNLNLLQDFSSIGLNDAAIIAKSVVNSGLMLAQRYPTAYDGIVVRSPAINWSKFTVANFWAPFVMNQLNSYPSPCIMDFINNATIKACDKLDGVEDGIISAPGLCTFDPQTLVGQPTTCGDGVEVTPDNAMVAKETWQGLQDEAGAFLWYGLNPGTTFAVQANTNCSTPTSCTSAPLIFATNWIQQFVLQNPFSELSNITHAQLATIFNDSISGYENIIDASNPDLSDFKQAGGKLIHYHGLADPNILPNGSTDYYTRVEANDPDLRFFYRFFEAPGIEHCSGGIGPVPSDPLAAMMAWVEDGLVPDVLPAVSADGTLERNLCPYPLVPAFQEGGNISIASSYVCSDSF